MKVVILAGGLGTRISEETDIKPKPMIEVGGKPILWHIMKLYSHYGFNEFVICAGYKAYSIKDFFYHYYMHSSDMTIDMSTNEVTFHHSHAEHWKVTVVDTGLNSMTGGRIKRVQPYIGDESFMLTYGDGVSNVNIQSLVDYHKVSGKLATLTAVQPSGKFGALQLSQSSEVTSFMEKPKGDGSWINGGFFVCEPDVFSYITEDDSCIWERGPMESLSRDGQLGAYKFSGFWKPMDTLRDKLELSEMWDNGNAPWKVW
ncbi:MAG: glucose-1-phosphate cytidylyltransferase [Opitutales bacterium]|nr:glucose-1-phosphate cytidylyltransferase [Opitutales bacterium]